MLDGSSFSQSKRRLNQNSNIFEESKREESRLEKIEEDINTPVLSNLNSDDPPMNQELPKKPQNKISNIFKSSKKSTLPNPQDIKKVKAMSKKIHE